MDMASAGIRRPIFVIGLNKSGTSLIYLCLAAHSQLSAVRTQKPPASSSKRVGSLYLSDHGLGEGQHIAEMPAKMPGNRAQSR